MRAHEPGQSVLLMLDVADTLTARQIRYAIIGALAAAVHGAIRASMDADAIVAIPIPEAHSLRGGFEALGLKATLRVGDNEDPVGALLAVNDSFGNRVDLLMGLRGMDPGLFARASMVRFSGESLQIVGREDFIAMKVFAGGPQDITDARSAIAAKPESLDLDLLRGLALRFGRHTALTLETLLP
jgi:hypothetical protein